jgi:hypothetical protein
MVSCPGTLKTHDMITIPVTDGTGTSGWQTGWSQQCDVFLLYDPQLMNLWSDHSFVTVAGCIKHQSPAGLTSYGVPTASCGSRDGVSSAQ